MKNHSDISGSNELCEVDVVGVACTYTFRKDFIHGNKKFSFYFLSVEL